MALAPLGGDSALDRRIAAAQQRAAQAADPVPQLEQLGNLFVVKARTDSDAGCFELARQCALAIEARTPGEPAALLLQGHVLHQQHHFAEAEAVARRLVAARGTFLDQGLLGDVLFDRGKTDEAQACYQAMLDDKPCLQSYARAAQIRWRRGDLEGTRTLLDLAMHAGTARDPEALAWVHADRARVELEAGDPAAAALAATAALQTRADYPPALLVLARAHLADGDAARAVEFAQRAAATRPEPEYRWTLCEALLAAGDRVAADRVAAELRATGARDDERTFAVYLATHCCAAAGPAAAAAADAAAALELTTRELERRADPRSHDAHAWALHAAGRDDEAVGAAAAALAEGTVEPRILLHVGAIALARGDRLGASRWLRAAALARPALLPSERRLLDQNLAAL